MNIKSLLCLGGLVMTLMTPSQAGSIPEKKLPLCPHSPNCVSSQAQATDGEHYIAPFKIKGGNAEAWAALKKALTSQSRTVITRETAEALHAEATSLVFRFVDDVDVILDAKARLLYIRSASRTGYSDLGVNRKRIEALRSALREAGAIE